MPPKAARKSRKRPADDEQQSTINSTTPAKVRRSSRSLSRLDLSGKWLEKIPSDQLKLQNASTYRILKLSCNYRIKLTEEIKNFKNLQELDASECGIQHLPRDLNQLKSIEKLCLFGNTLLKNFPKEILRLDSLTELNLEQCGLQEIPKEISQLNKLEKLNMRGNRRLRQVPVELFCLKVLRELNLGECGLTTLPSELSNVKELEKLQLFGNVNLRSIPNPVFALKLLKELDVGSCSLNQLPEEKRFPAKLQCLLLQGNRELGRVPRAVFSVSDSLKELNLACCGLTNIPENMKQLKKLEKLNISGNKELKTLPQSLYTLSKLRELNACECNLTDLEHVKQLKKLKNLYLRGNEELRQLPRGIMDLKDLVELDVSRCGLVEIDHNFSGLPKLKKLHISDNPHLWNLPMPLELPKNIEELNVSGCGFREMKISFARLTKLRTMYVSDCGRMEPQLIEKLPLATLKELDISGCSTTLLQITPDDLEKRCPQLVKLKLGSNTLLTTDLDKIFQLKKLEKLDISGCNLTQLPDVGDAGQRLTSLDVYRNSIGKLDLTALRRLEHLRELNLSACQLSQIPTEISELKYLVQLNLSQNLLSTLPNSVKKITQLEILDISDNFCMKELPQVIATLKALKKLDISLCPVLHLPNGFEKLTELEVLAAQNTGLIEYPNVTLQLKSLRKLNVSNRLGNDKSKNVIKDLPVKLVETLLEELLLKGNPMTKPPLEIIEQGMHAIRTYLTDIIPGSELLCAETVNMLGDTGAGKTSIVQSLRDRRPHLTEEADRTRVMEQSLVRLLNEQLVNINDFGGHDIYQTVLPMFLPPKGLGILTYNMADSIEEQKEKVSRWIITLLAKSPGIRLLVAGTHADVISNEDRARSEQEIQTLVKQKVEETAEELKAHISKLTCELRELKRRNATTEHVSDKLRFLKETLQAMQMAERSHVSLSCKEESDSGLSRLLDVVSRTIKPTDPLPASWCHVMNDIMQPEDSGSHSSYLEWKQVVNIFQKHIPDESNDEKLKVILRYLVSTSKIIWLEDHPTLGMRIFHRIDLVLAMCKAVLHHDVPANSRGTGHRLPDIFKADAEKYSRGHLSGTFLHHLLEGYSDEVAEDIMTDLMLQFNLISRVNEGGTYGHYIVPSRLEDEAPEEPIPVGECRLRTNVLVRMQFFSSTMPLALFETSLASVLNWVYANGISPECWKHGVCFRADGVTLSYLRNGDTLELKAAGDRPRELWGMLHPVLKTVAEHVMNLWKGALPLCALVCPGCRCCGTHPAAAQLYHREVSLEVFISAERFSGHTFYCQECKQDIPRSLLCACLPGTITDKDCEDAIRFMEKLVERCPRHANERPQSILKNKFHKASEYLLDELDECDARKIVDKLHAAGLDSEHYENFQALSTRSKKVRYLINDIIKHQPEETARVALETLESMPNRKNLVDHIKNQTIP